MSVKPDMSRPAVRESPGEYGTTGPPRKRAGKHRRLWRRIAVLSALSAVITVGTAAAAGFAVVHNALSHIRRVNVAYLTPLGGPSGAGQTILITSTNGSTNPPGTSPARLPTGLIMLLHINADQQGGGVVSIRPATVVPIPGHGRQPIAFALSDGGPSLLVETVSQVTHTPISHYASIDFASVTNVIDTIGGVDVDTPSGSIHLNGPAGLAYARDPALTEDQRVLRQQSLIRAVMSKVCNEHLLTNPATMVSLLNALTSMLTLDSNFTAGEITSLVSDIASMHGTMNNGPYLTAPVRTVAGQQVFSPLAGELWAAIDQDTLAEFAHQHPGTVTPDVVP